MGKVIAYPNKKLFAFFRVSIVVCVLLMVYSMVQYVISSFAWVWLLSFGVGVIGVIFFYTKSILNAIHIVIDKGVLFVYRSRELLAKDELKKVKVVKRDQVGQKYETVDIEVSGKNFRLSNLEFDGYDKLLQRLG